MDMVSLTNPCFRRLYDFLEINVSMWLINALSISWSMNTSFKWQYQQANFPLWNGNTNTWGLFNIYFLSLIFVHLFLTNPSSLSLNSPGCSCSTYLTCFLSFTHMSVRQCHLITVHVWEEFLNLYVGFMR